MMCKVKATVDPDLTMLYSFRSFKHVGTFVKLECENCKQEEIACEISPNLNEVEKV